MPSSTLIKSEIASPEISLCYDPDRMSAVELLNARNQLLEVFFDKGFTAHENHEEKERYSYPRVQFWTSKKESDEVSREDAEAGELPEKIAYLEDINGRMVDIKQVRTIRAELRGSFNHLLTELPRAIQPSWTQYDTLFQDAIYKHLRVKFPEFMLCDNNWKAKSFISVWYCNWMKNLKKNRKIQPKEKGMNHATAKVIPAKRHADNTPIPGPSSSKAKSNIENIPPFRTENNLPHAKAFQALTLNTVNLPNVLITDLTEDCEVDDTAEVQTNGAIELERELEEIESAIDSVYATVTRNNTPPPLTSNLPALDGTLSNSGPEVNTSGLALSVSFNAAHNLLALGNAPGNGASSTDGTAITQVVEGGHSGDRLAEGNAQSFASDGSGKGKRSKGEHKKRINPNSRTPENLFAIQFQKLHDGKGTVDQFNAAWQALGEEEKLKYQDESSKLASQKKTENEQRAKARQREPKAKGMKKKAERDGEEMSGSERGPRY